MSEEQPKLSMSEQAIIERNRQKALLIRQQKANKRLYTQIDSENKASATGGAKVDKKNEFDSSNKERQTSHGSGGFLLEDSTENDTSKIVIVHKPGGLLLDNEKPVCEECRKTFLDSYLFDHFLKIVCDDCRDKEEKHRLITKTEAKERYLLKDCDFDLREPALKFILKKNTSYKKYGEMKLYLECQVAERAAEIWGSDEKLEEEIERRNESKNKMKKKKFEKKMLDLRKSVRGSLFDRKQSVHEHEFGEETYCEVGDTYSKTCSTCGFVSTYEKM